MPDFSRKCVSDLVAIAGEPNVVTDEETRRYAEGGYNQGYGKLHGIYPNPLPIAVVKVDSTEQVAEVLRYCNENDVNVVPRTGISSGEGLLEVRDERSIVLDASPMNTLIEIDPVNMMATGQCGLPLITMEEAANKQGLTTGHSPQSLPVAQLGGLVATRSTGQFSSYYGGIEDMVCGIEAVMPDGRIIRIRPVPRRSAGPDLRHLFIGSEGALGVITEVTMKLFPYYPDDMWMGGYVLDNMEIGFRAIREVMAAGYKPSVVRLYDKPDIDHNFGSVDLVDEQAFMFFTAEGPPEVALATGEGIHRIALKHGGNYIGTKAVEHWLIHRNDLNDVFASEEFKNFIIQQKTIYTTTEISANWSEIPTIYKNVMASLPGMFENLVMLGGHVSHSYINGTNIYFVYQLKINTPETSHQEHMAVVFAICEEVLKHSTGGVVHHHGMGKYRIAYAEQEHGSSYSLMKDLKKMMDPKGIMCKGNLVPEPDGSRA